MTAVAVLLLVIEILMIKVIKNINNTKYDNIYNDDDDIQNNTKGYQISKSYYHGSIILLKITDIEHDYIGDNKI